MTVPYRKENVSFIEFFQLYKILKQLYGVNYSKYNLLSFNAVLTLKVPNKNCSRRHFNFYFYLSKKIRLDVSSESSA